MSIIHYLPDSPKEGSVVYADNGPYSNDRAVYKSGEFVGGGEFPQPAYTMSNVTKWFYLKEYGEKMESACYTISFEQAEALA